MLKRLRELRVEENTIKIVPEELGDCKSLQSLCLHVNSLRDLPIELEHLSDICVLEELHHRRSKRALEERWPARRVWKPYNAEAFEPGC